MATATAKKPEKNTKTVVTEALVLGEQNVWELTAQSVTFPIELQGGNFIAYASMAPYGDTELIQAIERATRGWVRDGAETKFLMEEDSAYLAMFDRHFLGLIGTSDDSDIEKQKRYLDAHPEIKAKVVKSGYGGVSVPPREVTFLDLDDLSSDAIHTHQTIYNIREKMEGEVNMTHHLNSPNNTQIDRYQKSQSRAVNNQTQEWRVRFDNKVLGQLYNDMISHVDGYTIHGEPCTEDNKNQWVPKMPLWHKTLVVMQRFREGAVKKT